MSSYSGDVCWAKIASGSSATSRPKSQNGEPGRVIRIGLAHRVIAGVTRARTGQLSADEMVPQPNYRPSRPFGLSKKGKLNETPDGRAWGWKFR